MPMLMYNATKTFLLNASSEPGSSFRLVISACCIGSFTEPSACLQGSITGTIRSEKKEIFKRRLEPGAAHVLVSFSEVKGVSAS